MQCQKAFEVNKHEVMEGCHGARVMLAHDASSHLGPHRAQWGTWGHRQYYNNMGFKLRLTI